jgi:hypothetical protein
MQPSDETACGIGVSGGPRVEPQDPALPISACGAVIGALADDRHKPDENRHSHNQSRNHGEAGERRDKPSHDRGEVEDHRRAIVGFTGAPAG